MVQSNSFVGPFGGLVNTATDGVRGGYTLQRPNGARGGGIAGPNGAGAIHQGPNGRIGAVGYIPGVGFGIGGINPANGNRGGLVLTQDGLAVKGNVNGQAFHNVYNA